MSKLIKRWMMSAFVCLMIPDAGWGVSLATWDTSVDSGYQNANGTWGVDDFWTFNDGTTLLPWSSAYGAWFGGKANVAAASPDGEFTVTVSGTQTAVTIRQIVGGAGNYTLDGGTVVLGAAGVRVDYGTFTVNSTISGSASTLQLTASASDAVIVLGGSNVYSGVTEVRGVSGGAVLLNNENALGSASSVTFVHTGVTLDVNGLDFSKDIVVNSGISAFLVNSGSEASIWSGDISMPSATIFTGGTGSELEISGEISGINVQVKESSVLRLSGTNTYTGLAVVREDGTLIVNNASALGTTDGITYVQLGATLDLNGFDVGLEEINMQQAYGRLVNENGNAAVAGGPIALSASGLEFGGTGNLILSGVLSGPGMFSKVGAGTLTLSATNSYAGATMVEEGTLEGGAGSFSESTEISVTNGASLVLQDVACLNALALLSLDATASLDLDYSGTQRINGLSLDSGSSWLASGTYDASSLSSLNASGTYTGSGLIEVFSPDFFEIDPAGLEFNWIGEVGVSYLVERSTNLVEGTWVPVASNLVGEGVWLNYTGTLDEDTAFYRITEE